ncbi:hypothetical protein G3N56_06140 [Desulfovibrio sulfodismutans]|uniref:Uncharacterized protein n=1 Tax=Desulfolutivibrio sulfodismutans TaxID=63561 RepID=A0A7K3NJE9_9BACT|nr:hypothetical protein [Desulfolutivibrio sulfodismutans]NDY56322.1 hypothetical protein [Desulfolutivibrio sulfodismutans]QLA11508.1 hypothetical protein GD606_04065 [Desulfolutivibrio sulfodismutans DSM 3696]QLA14193.1 hypothetical protein GD606_18935 [Desulfolutivibrio sulfodismutans DSM 3696]
MDQATIAVIIKALASVDATVVLYLVLGFGLTPFGLVCLVICFWWLNERKRTENERKRQEALSQYREDMHKVLKAYGDDLKAVAAFYRDNVKLVESYEKIADSLQDTVVLNTQVMQKLTDAVCTNQFCPATRLAKGDSPLKGPL